MLDLENVDLPQLCEALTDNSSDHNWWIHPETGELNMSPETGERDHPAERGWALVDPIDAREAYGDLADFTARVRDPLARELLERAIAGRGAFRRFKDTLFDFPKLREAWFRFHDTRMERRAVAWLASRDLIDEQAAAEALAQRPDPDDPEISGAFDAEAIARAVATDLEALYGDRLHRVVLFGSWARGDAHPESDVDLMVVLTDVSSTWAERDRMSDILWRHSLGNQTVVSSFVVSRADFEARTLPVIESARREGKQVA